MAAIKLYPEILHDDIDVSSNLKETTDIKAQVLNVVYSRMLDKFWYAPEYGINLPQKLLNTQPLLYGIIAKQAENELMKDNRIASCKVYIAQPIDNLVRVYINVTAISNESFDVVLPVSL